MKRHEYLGLLFGAVGLVWSAVAAAGCTLTPANAVVNAGESVKIQAVCDSAVESVEWQYNINGNTPTAIPGATSSPVSIPANTPFHYSTPVGLASGAPHYYRLRVNASETASGNIVAVNMLAPTLTVSVTGSGSVASNVGSISCPSGACTSTTVGNGASVVLTATAANTSTFTGWSGDCSGTGPCMVVMNGNRSVNATFGSQPVNGVCKTISAGYVTSLPSLSAGCESGASISAVANDNVNVLQWSCNGANTGTSQTCPAVPLGVNITLSAGSGGAITYNGSTGAMTVPTGSRTFTVTPNQGQEIASVSGCGVSSTAPYVANLTTASAGCTITATFQTASSPGQCNTATMATVQTAQPSTAQCASGSYVAGGSTSSSVNWTCVGTTTAQCSATRGVMVTFWPADGTVRYGGLAMSSLVPVLVASNATSFTVEAPNGQIVSAVGSTGGSTGCGPVSGTTGSASGTFSLTMPSSASQTTCNVSPTYGTATGGGGTTVVTDDPWGMTLWKPEANVWVVGQTMNSQGIGFVNWLPGCSNGQFAYSGQTDCAANSNYQGFTFAQGNVLSVRLESASSSLWAGKTNQMMSLAGADGGVLPAQFKIWLSLEPNGVARGTAASSTDVTACKTTGGSGTTTRQASFYVGPRAVSGTATCDINYGQRYYLNITAPLGCATCRVSMMEPQYGLMNAGIP